MPDILHDLIIQKDPGRVFEAVSQPELLEKWWTHRSLGQPILGGIYELDFGPGYQWEGVVVRFVPAGVFELKITNADPDWTGTLVGFELTAEGPGARLRFHHCGWREANEHFRVTSNCWGLYLRLLRRFLETGETIPYSQRQTA
ncbi:MAG: SRPBCC domain-containing protein [Gemmataceae bacterium]|nr:SRPBCC domain-containing protein [Gemmataceae bacterium]